jgi:hypothetical protein
MKKIWILFLFFALTTLTHAQAYQDVVYLKNGSIIRGTIIEQIPNVSLKIETSDKNVFSYKIEEIEKMTREIDPTAKKSSTKGYLGVVNIGYGFGTGDAQKINCIKFDNINGYRFNEYVSLGFGYGLKYLWYESGALLVPLFADVRVHALPGNISPFLALQIGYSIEITPEFQGLGLLLDPSLGVSFKTNSRSAVNLGVGYWVQKEAGYDGSTNFVHFDLGVSF